MDYGAFLSENWPLLSAFVVIIFLIIRLEAQQGHRGITPQEMTLQMNREHLVVIDIREKKEFEEAHIRGSKNIKPEFKKKQDEWTKYKKKKIVLVCKDGKQSALFADKLSKHIENDQIKVLKGGLLSWQGENFPVEC